MGAECALVGRLGGQTRPAMPPGNKAINDASPTRQFFGPICTDWTHCTIRLSVLTFTNKISVLVGNPARIIHGSTHKRANFAVRHHSKNMLF
jgi:hypothetical protein